MGRTHTACGFAIDEEYPPQLDTTCAPLEAAHFGFLHREILLRIRRQWLLDGARRAEPRFHEPAFRNSFGRAVLDRTYRAHVDRYVRRRNTVLFLARKHGFRCV